MERKCENCEHCDMSLNFAKIGVGDSPRHWCCKHYEEVLWCHKCEDWEGRK